MNKDVKIKSNDSFQEAIIKISEGNPGALRVSTDLMMEGEKIDPDDLFGGFGHILLLDTFGIYGSKIWMLYKDVCKENLTNMIAVLRGCQMGFVKKEDLLSSIENYGKGLDIDQILIRVQEKLPRFGKHEGV